jgi:radical SAM superfamily enzyme YgiQ (UPF0313 family)
MTPQLNPHSKRLLEELVKNARQHGLVLFVGAGVNARAIRQWSGLLSLSFCLLAEGVSDTVEILDGEFLSVPEIESRLSAEIVGISCTTPSYRNALLLAAYAKARGATVVLGGAHPTALAEVILRNRAEVDFVVRGDGEFALMRLLAGDSLCEIPNLAYREQGQVVTNPVELVPLDAIPPLRRDLLSLEPYVARYSARPGAVAGRRPAAIWKGVKPEIGIRTVRYPTSGIEMCYRCESTV